jgi:phosphoribosylformylglycinamidine synthase II/phosphoribosylformylglycinamidine synthase I
LYVFAGILQISEDISTMSESQVVGAAQTYRIEVSARASEKSATGSALLEAAQHLGITDVSACAVDRLYFLYGSLAHDDLVRLSHTLLADPVTEHFTIVPEQSASVSADHTYVVEVTPLPGVTDPAAENLLRAAHLLGITSLERAATGSRFRIDGKLSQAELEKLSAEVLANPVVQRFEIGKTISAPFFAYQSADDTVEIIAVRAADDAGLRQISAERRLALDLNEMRAVQEYYRSEDRDPSDLELEMVAQTWSEHCSHKTFRAKINYTGPQGSDPYAEISSNTIDGLLKTYIRSATEELQKPWIRSAFVDNAGIVRFDDQFDLAFKVETHNHPSALEPFGGANTGVGGVIRDVLGVSARPIANTDVLCFGPPDLPAEEIQDGVLHPSRIASGVMHGVEDYGNKMGIPTVNGAVLYHKGYTANPLVFCGCLGLLPHGSHVTSPQVGDLVVVLGGHTGRDGLRGATFSSMEMDQDTGGIASTAVQIGHPINEKQVLEVVLRARDEQLYSAITDCGAGGLSSAVGEMASTLGARVQLQDVPLKYPGLRPWEIWLSEAQERMVLAVPPSKWERLREVAAGQDVDAIAIGTFTGDGRIELLYGDRTVGSLSMHFLHEGMPRRELQAEWKPSIVAEQVDLPSEANVRKDLLSLLSHHNIRSKEPVVRRYDHEIQGGTAVKPFVGPRKHGHGDASVIVPRGTAGQSGAEGAVRGVALSAGICPSYGELDPYAMAWAAVDEAFRNLVSVGGNPDEVSILDNFCWGNPTMPDRLGALVRCSQGCYDAAIAYSAPFISGKDSLNNEYADAEGVRHAIPGTLLISAMGIVPDVRRTTTADLKQAGDVLYLLGETKVELGGSHYGMLHGLNNSTPPQPVANALDQMRSLHNAIAAGLVSACHDCSEGGLAVSLAEMCIAGQLGANVNIQGLAGLPADARDDVALFSESLTRFVVAVRPENVEAFEQALNGVALTRLGSVVAEPVLTINGNGGSNSLSLAELEAAWCAEEPAPAQPEAVELPAPSAKPVAAPSVRTASPRVLILHANGTNRDHDAALACELAGGKPEIVHVNQLFSGERSIRDYQMIVVPGGFSYGDDLGAGTRWALDLRERLGQDLERFIAEGRPVLGICNGFQTLVKSGLLPGESWHPGQQRPVTLTYNHSGHFECRWVYLEPNPNSACLFTAGITEPIFCPVAHGEGRLAVRDDETRDALWRDGLIALSYTTLNGEPVVYPHNPNGSELAIAGLCNQAGNVMGLMPHPENHVFPWQNPHFHRGDKGQLGLRLFQNGIKSA